MHKSADIYNSDVYGRVCHITSSGYKNVRRKTLTYGTGMGAGIVNVGYKIFDFSMV